MPPGRKQGAGCWTCRLRRKRCDSVQPVCGSCQSLEITCYSGEARPSWMDGGSGQKHMSETIKGRIKQNALFRRERRLLAHGDHDMIMAMETDRAPHEDAESASALVSFTTSRVTDPVVEYDALADSTASTPSTSLGRPNTLRSSVDPFDQSQSPLTIASWTSGPRTLPSGCSAGNSQLAVPIQVQLGSVMIYLDYVFPFLFPFYQPSLVETGRQWLLGLLCQNDVSFHLASSLSAYFFSLVPQSDDQDMHDDCKALVWDKLIEQMDLAIGSIQSTVSAVSGSGAQSPLLDKTRIMQEITQLLVVEVTVRNNVNWMIHLTPALSIFDEIFKCHGVDHSSGPSLNVLSNALPSSIPVTTQHHKALPNTADQSALVFFVSLLLFVDIVASTSLGTSPALQSYHSSLFSSQADEKFRLRLESVVGCQNWALVAIGNISALCAWKRDAKQSGNFSVFNLVNLADPISKALEKGLEDLNIGPISSLTKKASTSRLEAYYSRHDRAIDYSFTANITRIWAHAAIIYLSVSLSGWQTNNHDMQASVAQVLGLLEMVDSPGQLRSLSWPICIAGCLALPAQEHIFRRIVSTMGPLGKFGTLSNALGIMEAVWKSRNTIDGNVWDIASSLSILGSPSLLI
ncbi:putative Transcription factor dibT [Seiridium cardinale]|uniref:Transcription factor dibT n=1 Tax=Seiridium cardinale TaxID=138064 RepID=A0ABR2YA28_9PEZI